MAIFKKTPFKEGVFEKLSISEGIKEIVRIIKGNAKAETLINHLSYIKEKAGQEAVDKILLELEKNGIGVKIEELKTLEQIPDNISTVVVYLTKTLLGWSEQEIYEMGNNAPKTSFITKTLMRGLFSIDMAVKMVPKYWRVHFSEGSLSVPSYDKKNKTLILKLDYHYPPSSCWFVQGYFRRAVQLIVGSNPVIEQTKFMYKGDPYQEFIIKW
jgi:hypothetical protein